MFTLRSLFTKRKLLRTYKRYTTEFPRSSSWAIYLWKFEWGHVIKKGSKAAFTLKTKVGNSSWCVWPAQNRRQTLPNCWRQIELASILTNFFELVNSYLTCERLANMCCELSTNQNKPSIHVIICVILHKIADASQATFKFIAGRGSQLSGCVGCFICSLQRY